MSETILRILTPDDKDMLYQHYQALDPESKGCRFGVQISDYALSSFIAQLDLTRDIHFAVVKHDRILALAQISKYSQTDTHRLELGISVATLARRQGLASLLWDCATAHAVACNMQEIYVLHSPRNKAMGTFCRQKGLHIKEELGERVGIWLNPQWSTQPIPGATEGDWPGILPLPSPIVSSVPTLMPV
jgi:hypothetical protein